MEQVRYMLKSGLRHIRVDRFLSLVAVIDYQGFTPAAEALYLSQPQVSRHIAELEEALGYRLIDRLARPPEPTADGQQFARHAREIVHILQQAGDDSIEYLEGPIGSVVVGMYPSAAYYAYPTLRRLVDAEIHNVNLQLWEGMPHELLTALNDSGVDLVIRPGLEDDRLEHGTIESRRLWTEPLVAVVSPDADLPSSESVPVDYLARSDLIVIGNPRADGPPENEVGEALRAYDLLSRISMRTDLPTTLIAMVRGGLGTGIINALAIGPVDTDGLVVRPIMGSVFERTVYLSSRKQDAKRQNIKRIIQLAGTLPKPADSAF